MNFLSKKENPMTQTARYVLSVLLIMAFISMILWFGCGDTSVELNETDIGDDDDDNGDDDDDDTADHQAPEPPNVDTPRSPTGLDIQTITGSTEPGALVRITGGSDETTTYADASSGDFCVTTPLILNAVNQLAVTAEDAAGNEGEPTNIVIEQARNNVSFTGTPYAASVSHSDPTATEDKAIDGNYNTYWANTTQTIIHPEADRIPQWYAVKFQNLEIINRLDIYWSLESYGTDFDIYTSQVEEPSFWPHEQGWGGEFTLLVDQENGLGFDGHNSYDLADSSVETRWIMLVLNKSRNQNLIRYKFEIIELEAYSIQDGDEEDPGC